MQSRINRFLLAYALLVSTLCGTALGSTTGACWNDRLSVCAEFVVKQAEIAASRMELER